MALSDPSASGRGLLHPDVFFEVLEANSVALGRSAGRVLLRQFQEPSGAMQAAKFLRWMALSAPGDHVNPELLFARLPQPYRRIQKVLDCDIVDAAWSIIATQSAKFKAENFASPVGAAGTEALPQQQDDYGAAKARSCQPTEQLALASKSQRVAGLVAHSLAPIVVAALHHEASTDPTADSEIAKPSLRVVSTAKELEVLGDFPIEFSVAAETSGPLSDASPQSTHVRIKSLSELQRVGSDVAALEQSHFSYYLAVHLEQTTTVLESGDSETPSPPAPTTQEVVNVYSIETQNPQTASDGDASTNSQPPQASCRLFAVLHPTPDQPVASVLLSPDVEILATSTQSGSFAFYSLRRQDTSPDAASDDADHPLALSAPAFRVELEPNRSASFTKEPLLHFLVAPATTQDDCPAALTTYAFVICHGVQVLKYLLPAARNASSSPPPSQLTAVKTWEHLTAISSSTLDATTQFLALGLEDGSLVVWDVLRDVDHAFLAPLAAADGKKDGMSSLGFCRDGYLVALSTTTQRLFFYDVRARGRPALIRAVTPPPATTSHDYSLAATSAVLMEKLAMAPATADVPVVLIEHSNGMVLLYDVRSGQAIGSFTSKAPQTPTAPSASSSSTSLLPKAELSRSARTIAANQEALCVVSSQPSALQIVEESVGLYTWRDVLLACFPSFSSVLQQRQEEPESMSSIAPERKLQPFVPDDHAFFAQYCRERLDPVAIADKEAKLHRKRRDLLKALASGGAW
ncbi:hypothetical protein BBJ28_00002903 [Nothophytophthora sp. Chile5]|nr:hypothetical protein BBJ28_00002903 [Nothophytophthora sp. Chile5]